ncbi:uncharacterized protein SCHCODRAFT_02637604 [Schizophyllum commune H4-8]|nr:uncharacterized protein SCHCODRAFT_02637604 [Schizophyllum commune H4-8]KAI5888755.1 hypothetical protein SCHCODRAFT_02637604 [Schizophyllum commune H4-8]
MDAHLPAHIRNALQPNVRRAAQQASHMPRAPPSMMTGLRRQVAPPPPPPPPPPPLAPPPDPAPDAAANPVEGAEDDGEAEADDDADYMEIRLAATHLPPVFSQMAAAHVPDVGFQPPAVPEPAPATTDYTPVSLADIPVVGKRFGNPEILSKAEQTVRRAEERALAKLGMTSDQLVDSVRGSGDDVPSRVAPQTEAVKIRAAVRFEAYFERCYPGLPKEYAWHAKSILDLTLSWLDYQLVIVQNSMSRTEKLQSMTIAWWAHSHVSNIIRAAVDPVTKDRCAAEILVTHRLYDRMIDQVVALAKKYDLRRKRPNKLYFDYPEVGQIIGTVLGGRLSSNNWMRDCYRIQKVLVMFYCGSRPSTIGDINPRGQPDPARMLTLSSILWERVSEAMFIAQITFDSCKGALHSHNVREQVMNIRSVNRPEFVMFDLTIWLLATHYHEGYFGTKYGDTFIAFLQHPARERTYLPQFRKRAIFPAMNKGGRTFDYNQPCSARAITEAINHAAAAAMLPATGSYVLRRAGANWIAGVIGHVAALDFLNHRAVGETAILRNHYLRGAKDYDWTGIRFGVADGILPEKTEHQREGHLRISVAVDAICVAASRYTAAAQPGTAATASVEELTTFAARENHLEVNAAADSTMEQTQAIAARQAVVDKIYALFTGYDKQSVRPDAIRNMMNNAKISGHKTCYVDDTPENQALAQSLYDEYLVLNENCGKVRKTTRHQASRGAIKKRNKDAIDGVKKGTGEERAAAVHLLRDPSAPITNLILQSLAGDGRDPAELMPVLQDDEQGALLLKEAKQGRGNLNRLLTRRVGGDDEEEEADGDFSNLPPPSPHATLAGLDMVQAWFAFAAIVYGPFYTSAQEQPLIVMEGGKQKFVCNRCLILARHCEKNVIVSALYVPKFKGTYESLSAYGKHNKRLHHLWRQLILEIYRTKQGLACPAGDAFASDYVALVEHMHTNCARAQEYLAIYEDFKTINRSLAYSKDKSTGEHLGTLRGIGRASGKKGKSTTASKDATINKGKAGSSKGKGKARDNSDRGDVCKPPTPIRAAPRPPIVIRSASDEDIHGGPSAPYLLSPSASAETSTALGSGAQPPAVTDLTEVLPDCDLGGGLSAQGTDMLFDIAPPDVNIDPALMDSWLAFLDDDNTLGDAMIQDNSAALPVDTSSVDPIIAHHPDDSGDPHTPASQDLAAARGDSITPSSSPLPPTAAVLMQNALQRVDELIQDDVTDQRAHALRQFLEEALARPSDISVQDLQAHVLHVPADSSALQVHDALARAQALMSEYNGEDQAIAQAMAHAFEVAQRIPLTFGEDEVADALRGIDELYHTSFYDM